MVIIVAIWSSRFYRDAQVSLAANFPLT